MKRLLLIGMVSALAACSASEMFVPSGEDAAIQTDRLEYVLTPSERLIETSIHLTYTNRTGAAVHIHSCGGPQPPRLEKQEQGRWVTALEPVMDLCLGLPITVAAGATYVHEYRLTAGVPGTTAFPHFEVASIPGTYRLVWDLYHEAVPGSPPTGLLPLRERVSNEFRLTE